MNAYLKFAIGIVFGVILGQNALAQIVAPQGRLTLQNNTPVMNADTVGASILYYTPYVGNSVPISNGTSIVNQSFSQLSLSVSGGMLTAQNTYDVYVVSVSGSPALCVVGAWSADNHSRSSGYDLTIWQGLWVNAGSVTCNTATTNIVLPIKGGIYLGSVYATQGGLMTMQFKPDPQTSGNGTLLGLYNAYNRVRVTAMARDGNTSWAVTTPNHWADADAGGGYNYWNRITWLDGLQQSNVTARYEALFALNSNASAALVGIDLDDTSLTPDIIGAETVPTSTNFNGDAVVVESWLPQKGLHLVQAMQQLQEATPTTLTFYGSPYQELTLETEY